jgi:short-subunit dehydrogenase
MSERILITGASKGIGRDLARLCAAAGHDLVLVARSRDLLQALSDELTEQHDISARVESCDLLDADAPGILFERLGEDGVDIDILINNAGFGDTGRFDTLRRDRQLGQIDLNVRALTELTHLFLPGMVARRRGRILNIASTAGFQPGPYMAVYYATKAYVISFTEALAEELRGTGVTATAHCPGATASEFGATSGNDETRLFQQGHVASSEAVAAHAYAAMMRGDVLAIHGAQNWLGAFMVRLTPRWLLRRVVARINQPAGS